MLRVLKIDPKTYLLRRQALRKRKKSKKLVTQMEKGVFSCKK